MTQTKTFIIIPVHNRKDITLSCLNNLKVNGDLDKYHPIVVDDGSTDGTTAAIIANHPDVTILSGDGNLWWTGAIVLGMNYAYEQGANYIIWLNDDSQTAQNTIGFLIEFMAANPKTIVGSSCYGEKSNLLIETGFIQNKRAKATENEIVNVDGLSGYCVGIPRSVISEIGFPDDNKFRHYAGDSMYTLKATRAGFRCCILGNSKVILLNETNPISDFRSYIKYTKKPTLMSVFWSYKSPYHLPTQFSFYIYKCGLFKGIIIFLIKLSYWIIQFYV